MPLLQSDADPLQDACGDDPSWVCEGVYEATETAWLADAADMVLNDMGRIVLIVAMAWLVSRLLRRAIRRFGKRILLDDSVLGNSVRAEARSNTLVHVLRSMTAVVVWTIALITILGELGVNLGPLIASAGIAGVALGFGAQNVVKDVLAGFFVLVEDQYGVGDIVDLGEANGVVEAVSLRSTRLRDIEGNLWHVPNGNIERVANKSQEWSRALLDVNVAYGTDVDQASQVIRATAEELWQDPEWEGRILERPEVWGVEGLSADAVDIRLVVKTQPAEQWNVTREMRRRLLRAFEDARIEIPFSQRTVWLRHDQQSESGSSD